MRNLFKAFLAFALLALVGIPLALLAAVWLAVDRAPLIARTADIKPENVARAKRILERNDPRRMRPGALRSIVVGAEDLDLAVNYLANQYGRGSAQVTLQQGAATLRASLRLPENPLGDYINIDAAVVETGGLPRFDSLTLGRLPVPGFVANWLLDHALERLQAQSGVAGAADAIKRVSLRGGALLVIYEWNDRLPEQIRRVLVSGEDQARYKAYQEALVRLAGTGGTQPLPMERLLGALLEVAAQRGGDAVAENRALILALAFFVNGKGLEAVIPGAKEWPRPAPRNVLLGGRHDFAQHHSISAALAAAAGSPLADAVGLYKEIDDSKGGSGFSFNDIAADRAGTRLGEVAVANAAQARKLQTRGKSLAVADILPEVADLPEFMQEAEFKRRFGGVGGAEYRRMMAMIEGRVGQLAVLR